MMYFNLVRTYYSFARFIVLISSLLYLGCTAQAEQALKLKPYLDTLPDQESINASIYHYEILTEHAKNKFQDQQYLEVLRTYQKYLKVFYESEVFNENQLLYYTGMSLTRLGANSQPTPAFEKFLNQYPDSFKIFGIYKNEDSSIHYNYIHFRKILENRLNYPLERTVLKEYYLEDFILNPQTTEEHDRNFEYLYYLSTHFPNMIDYSHLLNNPNIIDQHFLNRQEREKLKNIERIIQTYSDNLNRHSPGIDVPIFPTTGGLILRNRTHLISSRNFARLEAWEPLTLIRSVTGEDGNTWWEVAYKELSTAKTYIPVTEDFLTEVETLDGEVVSLDKSEKSLESVFLTHLHTDNQQKSLLHHYMTATKAFYAQDYLTAAEKVSHLIPRAHGKTQERALTLLYKTLQEITKRSTSLENDYTHFIRTHPHYFKVLLDPAEPPQLKVTDEILKMLMETNPHSVMLQYHITL